MEDVHTLVIASYLLGKSCMTSLQKKSIGQVTAMVIARIEQKPEQLCAGDEFQEVGYVVQKGLRSRRHHKDLRAKYAHPFVRVVGGPTLF